MRSTKQILADVVETAARLAGASIRLTALAVPLTLRLGTAALIAALKVVDPLIAIVRKSDVGKTAKRGSRALSRLAKEADSRRPRRKTQPCMLRKLGIAGTAIAAVIAIILYVPRRIMDTLNPPQAEPETPTAISNETAPTDPVGEAPASPTTSPERSTEANKAPAARASAVSSTNHEGHSGHEKPAGRDKPSGAA